MDLPALRALLESDTFAAWVRALGLQLNHALPGEVELALPVTPQHVHGGGMLCGQSMMAAADTAMALAICTLTDGYRPMTTVQLQTSFLRPIAGDAGSARVTARVLRKGRNLVFGEIEVADPKGALAAHATTTYALL
ncbi:MAG: PaaI family thioesterase [Burkholderiaceae bacterium]|nr:MAG: PaaI family thioesterase [Burkholderiaceae bacterium]MBE7427217.1 PaaI family thioesterase [Ideonella sp.]MCC7285567.1 PaaI family thioesterase [Burkholderiaceae bacterium]